MECHTCGGIMERVGKNIMQCPECGRSIRFARNGYKHLTIPPSDENLRRKEFLETIGA